MFAEAAQVATHLPSPLPIDHRIKTLLLVA